MVLGWDNKIWFWFLPQMAISAFSSNLLKSLISKDNFTPFQSEQIVYLVHFKVYLNLIEVNKILIGTSSLTSGKKSN